MSPAEFLVVGAASWTVLACLATSLPGCASAIGKFRAARRRTYTDLSLHQPPVPVCRFCRDVEVAPQHQHHQPQPEPAWDETALDVWPADASNEELEAAIYNRLFEDVVAGEFPETRREAA